MGCWWGQADMMEYLTLRQMEEVLKTNVVPISRPPTQMSIVKMFFKIPIFSTKSDWLIYTSTSKSTIHLEKTTVTFYNQTVSNLLQPNCF